jgi:hypothetical protein
VRQRSFFSLDFLVWIALGLPILLPLAIANLLFALLHLVWEGRATVPQLPQLPGLLIMGLVLSRACWSPEETWDWRGDAMQAGLWRSLA